MQSFNITLPNAIANALSAYIGDQEVSLPASAIVENALEEFLSQCGYFTSTKARFTPNSCTQGKWI
ncbi:hypothetical protein [Nostoc sp.]|uniref:hypothetical protein n=1 Tax=Nostoc sp. TaxID=1180 RepID=UPI002FF5F09F